MFKYHDLMDNVANHANLEQTEGKCHHRYEAQVVACKDGPFPYHLFSKEGRGHPVGTATM